MFYLVGTYPLMFGAWPPLRVHRPGMIKMPFAKPVSQVPSTIACGRSFRRRRISSNRSCLRPRPRNYCLMFVRKPFRVGLRHELVCRGNFLRCSRIFGGSGNFDTSSNALRFPAVPRRYAFASILGTRHGLSRTSSKDLKLAAGRDVGRSGCSGWRRVRRPLLAKIRMPCFK